MFDAGKPGDVERAEAFGAAILTRCIEAGGSVTGEHGVGLEKLDVMCLQFQTAELERMHALKQAFDPQGLLNPGKAVPALHRCGEVVAQRRRMSRPEHADLPAF
jgi:glycolate oxidase